MGSFLLNNLQNFEVEFMGTPQGCYYPINYLFGNSMESRPDVSTPKLRVLEFYSGIGGMHYGLKLAKKGCSLYFIVIYMVCRLKF
jgi:hypothetical protein